MNSAYCFSDLNELINFLEYSWSDVSDQLPVIYQTPDGEFAIKSSEVVQAGKENDLKLLQDKVTEKPFLDMFNEMSGLELLGYLRLKPWSFARDFSVELMILLMGDRADFEHARDYLFNIEHGAEPPFKVEVAIVRLEDHMTSAAGPENTYLLRLKGLHAYAPLERWLADNKKFQIYYPYSIPRVASPGHSYLYVQWGYELSPIRIKIFDQDFATHGSHPDDEFVLFSQNGEVKNVSGEFQSLFYFHNVEIANLGRIVPGSVISLEPKGLFDVKLELRTQANALAGFEYSEAKLLERIDILRIQLERLRLQHSATSSPHIYVYEDHGSGMRSFQDFILRLPVRYLNQYLYHCMELEFDGRKSTYHFITAKHNVFVDGRKPFNADYEFYKWNQKFIAGYNIYLPVYKDERLVLFPPIFPETETDEDRCILTLLREYSKLHEKGSGDCLLLWPAGETIFQVHLPLATGSMDLGNASALINTNFVMQKAKSVKSAPEIARSSLEEAFDQKLQDFLQTSKTLQEKIDTVLQKEQENIRRVLGNAEHDLRQAEHASLQAEQIRCIYQNIMDIRNSNLNEWYAFVEKVVEAHQAISKNVGEEHMKLVSLTQSVQTDLETREGELINKTTALVKSLRNRLPEIKPKTSLLHLREQLETLLDDLQEQINI